MCRRARVSARQTTFSPSLNDVAWTDTVTALATAVGAASLIGVAVQVRETRLAREAEVTIDFSRRWDEDLVRQARHKVTREYESPEALREGLKKFRADKDDQYGLLLTEPNYYEDLAVMCDRGVLDKRIIRESLGETLYGRWQRWELAVLWLRETDPLYYVHFEALALEMRDQTIVPTLGEWLTQRVRLWPRKA